MFANTSVHARVIAALLSASALTLASPAIAQAQSQSAEFAIPAQDLGAALTTWSAQAGMQIFYPAETIAGRRAPAVQGRMSARAALDRLIDGSGLIVTSEENGFVTLRAVSARRQPAAGRQSAAPASGPIPTADETIIVTAQRREQSVRDVPFALSAFSGEALDELGVVTLRDLSLYTPGLVVEDQSPNNPIFVMRGITSAGGDSFTEPRVSVFQDGVPISKSRGSFVELFDIARVEVAKGPQSTLFGRGALIGGINVIQNRAGDEFDWSVAGEAGDLGHALIDGMINLPLGEGAAIRFAGIHRQRDGSLENLAPSAGDDLNAIDLNAFRTVLSIAPSNRFSADLILNYQEEETDGTGFKSMYMSPTNPATGEVLAGTRTDDAVWLAAPADFAGGRGLGVDQNYVGATALIDFALTDALTLNSITGYREVESVEVYDADGISLPLFTNMEDIGGRYFSQELRLSFDQGGPFSGFVGVSYYRERARAEVDVRFDERMLLAQAAGMLNGGPVLGLPATTPAPEALFANTAFTGALVQGLVAAQSGGNLLLSGPQAEALAARLNPGHVETSRNTTDVDSVDIFADVTFRPTDRWEISAGLRYSDDDKTTRWGTSVEARSILGGLIGASGLAASGSPTGIATANMLLGGLSVYGTDLAAPLPYFGINAQPTANNGDVVSQDLSDDGLTWRLAARYEVSDELNLYASYGRGRRPAVLSATAPGAPGGLPTFTIAPAEIADSVEIGFKVDLPERALRLDAALYGYQYENFQTRELIGSGFVTTNAGEAEALGAELQGTWSPVSNFDLFATYAHNHARFTRGAYDDNHFARSPDHMISLAAALRMPAPGGEFEFRPSYTWRSKIFFADDNDRPELQTGRIVADLLQDEFQDGYGLLNLRLGYAPDEANWAAEIFINNATDEIYRKGAGSAGESIGLPTNVLGEPRVYGVRLTLHH